MYKMLVIIAKIYMNMEDNDLGEKKRYIDLFIKGNTIINNYTTYKIYIHI